MVPSLLAWVAVVVWTWLLGAALLAVAGGKQEERNPALVLLAGLVVCHLLLQALAWTGVGWTRGSLVVALTITGAAAAIVLLRSPLERRLAFAPSPWDLISASAVAAFAAAAFALKAPLSDFVYHWGFKARRFFELETLDFEFLARPENTYLHPDYPNLLPELYAASSVLAGRFEPAVLMLWSPLFLAVITWAVRQQLEQTLGNRHRAALGTAAVATCLAAFCIGYYQAGGADVPMALGMLVGALLIWRGEEAPLAIGVSAAFVAATKIEGVPLAAVLVGCYLLRRAWQSRRTVAQWAALLVPPAVVVAAWWLPVRMLGLFQPGNVGWPRGEQLSGLISGIWYSVTLPPWYGLPFLLLLLPLILVSRPLRWLAFVLTLQLGVYLGLYMVSPLQAYPLVIASFPRLMLQLMPGLLVALLLWVEGARRWEVSPGPGPALADRRAKGCGPASA